MFCIMFFDYSSIWKKMLALVKKLQYARRLKWIDDLVKEYYGEPISDIRCVCTAGYKCSKIVTIFAY